MIIHECTNNDIDVALITETLDQRHTRGDLAWLNQSELHQDQSEISTHKRPCKKGWWYLPLIFGRNNNMKLLKKANIPTLEYAIWRYTIRNKPIHIIGIYHPLLNGEHNTTNGI